MTTLATVVDILREYGAIVMSELGKNGTADGDAFGDQTPSAANDAPAEQTDAQGD